MNQFIKDESIWRKFGAENLENFVSRMKQLPENFQRFILKGQYNYTLTLAEKIQSLLRLSHQERQEKLLTPEVC